jgi:hypothetical protein
MRYATDIQLDQLIVHILDPWRPDGFVLSERTLPLDSNQRLANYFAAHIQNSLQDSGARAARFVTLDDSAASGICTALLDGRLDLVEGSRQLAERLYGIIARDQRISAGDLAVGFYRAGNRPHVPHYLALLKIDPSEVFRHKTERDPQGNLYVSFEIETNVMPTTREKIQKCAFVQPLDPRPEYDMMLLDRQVRPTVPVPVARFFAEDFLGAQLALDPRQRTDRLYRSLVSAHNQLRPVLRPQEDESLRQAIDGAITSASINIDTWLEALRLPEEPKQHIDRVVSQELPDREFEIDTIYAEQLTRKRRFRGDYDLRVEVSAERYNEVIRSVEHIEDPGEPAYYRIVIHTERWDEIPR